MVPGVNNAIEVCCKYLSSVTQNEILGPKEFLNNFEMISNSLIYLLESSHWIFRSHLNRIGIPVQETLCRKCGEADETAKHVIFECPALQSKRSRSLGVLMHTEEGLEQESIVQKISWFCKGGWNRKALFRRSHGFVKALDLIQLKPERGCTISRMAERQLPGLGNLALCYKKKAFGKSNIVKPCLHRS
ncbi:hypothetical protein J6590_071764 [Homalodisca vitripennis]|nr:hypothetical protein J6590_071764 [Homalodisca vitripennis]